MMLRRVFVRSVVVAAGLLPAVTFASPPDAPPLTLRQAKDEAARANPDLDALRRMSAAAARRPDAERYLMPPMVEAQAFEWPFDTLNPRRAQLMFGLAQEWPGRGKRERRVAVLERQAAVVANEVPMKARDIASDVALAYADLAFARRTIEVVDESVALVQQMADAAEARYAAGGMGQQDVLKAIVERSRLEEQRLMAMEQASMAEARRGLPTKAAVGGRLVGRARQWARRASCPERVQPRLRQPCTPRCRPPTSSVRWRWRWRLASRPSAVPTTLSEVATW